MEKEKINKYALKTRLSAICHKPRNHERGPNSPIHTLTYTAPFVPLESSKDSGGGSGNPSPPPPAAAFEKPSRASIVFNTAQLYDASPGGTTRKIYVLSVNRPRKILNCGVLVCMTTKPAEAGVVRVLRAAQCLKAFMIFERRSWRS